MPPALAFALANRIADSCDPSDLAVRSLGDCTQRIGEPDRVEQAAETLLEAARTGSMGILCDFDVDGSTSQAILVETMRAVWRGRSPDPVVAVPFRNSEGFGPNERCLDMLIESGVSCVAVVDCGTAAGALLDRYQESTGIVPVVIDHHPPHRETPPASGPLVNPWVWRGPSPGEQGTLCAAALTWFVARAILRQSGLSAEDTLAVRKRITLLAAIGTACDMMRLDMPFNRSLVRTGVRLMSDPSAVPPGLAAIRETAGLKSEPAADDFGWRIGPRINAGSRMGESDLAARCIRERNPARARELAENLDRLNRLRIETGKLAAQELEGSPSLQEFAEGPVNVHVSREATPGTVGLVASRMVKRFGWPAFALSDDGQGVLIGSGRGALHFDVGATVSAAHEHGILLTGGGHANACGLSLARNRIGDFKDFVSQRFAAALRADAVQPEPTYQIDASLDGKGPCRRIAACGRGEAARTGTLGVGLGTSSLWRAQLLDQETTAVAGRAYSADPCLSRERVPGGLVGIRHRTGGRGREWKCRRLQLSMRWTEQLGMASTWPAQVALDDWNGRRDGRLVVRDARPSVE